ncbi:PAP2 superfamily protein [Xylariomycetidae sp. FL0641]|nr:PAP2 superfamily protein [Xylariomycetidae sp. FL0641]
MAPPRDRSRPRDGGASSTIVDSIARFWTHSYAPDYLGLASLVVAYILIQIMIEPFHRMFFINNLNIAFPHAEIERVPVWLNVVYAAAVPLGFVLVFNSLYRASWHKHHSTLLGLAIALILASFLTDVVKNAVGRPRPDLIARCKPARGTKPDTLVTIDVCTETDHHTLHDGWRSFPSGHSSFSFAGLGYLACFLAGQLRIFRDKRDLGRSLVCLAPLVGAAMIAISRCEDYRHDVYDVCVGSLLGFTVAFWTYRRYWPALGSLKCDEPYPTPGTDLDDMDGWRRVRDEEEGGPILGRNVAYEMASLRRYQS